MNRMVISFGAFLMYLFVPPSSWSQWRGYGEGRWFGPGMMDWGMWGGGWIFMLLFWGLVIVALIFLIRWLAGLSRPRPSSEKPHDSALEILRQRYAKGEIDNEEFDQKKRDLM
ncbi:MAG TPA: SHOCT domain-containing protein [Desulfatiglandales bacterium]